jgi:rhodanese-related sulfurtransferase
MFLMKLSCIFMKQFLVLLVLTFLLCGLAFSGVNAQVTKPELAKDKQTTLGLYVTAKEAYEKWKSEPEKVKILDVRTTDEYLFVGHPAMAWNAPLLFQSYDWDQAKQKFPMKPNPDFLKKVKEVFQVNDVILVTCRSGGRSAMAVNQLAEAGFKNVYNITDGFEGDAISDAESVFVGKRMKNGWKNSGLPWTYAIDSKLLLVPETK